MHSHLRLPVNLCFFCFVVFADLANPHHPCKLLFALHKIGNFRFFQAPTPNLSHMLYFNIFGGHKLGGRFDIKGDWVSALLLFSVFAPAILGLK